MTEFREGVATGREKDAWLKIDAQRKEIERLQDLLDRVVEDNAALRACNEDLIELVGTLRASVSRMLSSARRSV